MTQLSFSRLCPSPVPESGGGEKQASGQADYCGPIAAGEIEALPAIATDVSQNESGCAARSALVDAAVRVDPGRETRIRGDQERFAALDRAEDAAGQVHVQLAGAPELTVVGDVD